jgi:predicted glycosyltransferase
VTPRREQLIRARRLGGLGHLDVLEPDALSAGALSLWLGARARKPRRLPRIDMGGLRRLPSMLDEVLGAPRATAVGPVRAAERRRGPRRSGLVAPAEAVALR